MLRPYCEPAPGNATSVDFWDMATNVWVQLPSLNRGRRSHTMTTIEVSSLSILTPEYTPPLSLQGQLAVAGGVGLSPGTEKDTELLSDVEVFDGKRWKRAASGLDQPRRGANLVKIPYSQFRG